MLFNFGLSFTFYGPLLKKVRLRFLIDCVVRDLASRIASILKNELFSVNCARTQTGETDSFTSTVDTGDKKSTIYVLGESAINLSKYNVSV